MKDTNTTKALLVEHTITTLLNKTGTNWEKLMLYSWSWGSGREYLSPKQLFEDKKPSRETVIMRYPDISASLYESKKPLLNQFIDDYQFLQQLQSKICPNYVNNHNFLIDMKVKLFPGLNPENFVITNINPDPNMFGKDVLYSEIGKWRTGLF